MKNYNIEQTADRIRELRETRGYTQEQISVWLNVDRRHIARMENGTRGCSVDMFIRLAELYDVSLDYLILGKDTDARALKSKLDAFMEQITVLRDSL